MKRHQKAILSSRVTYPSLVDSKPTDMATVYTTMKRCVEMCNTAGQQYSIQTFDQQLYAIAQQVKWSYPTEFKDHILHLWGFHTLSCYISCIGKLWCDAGLSDILVESGIYASCTVEQILAGKQFKRAVRALTLVYEALMSLWLTMFFEWCDTNNKLNNVPEHIWTWLIQCHGSFSNLELFNVERCELIALVETHNSPLIVDFREFASLKSATFRFWDMFYMQLKLCLKT